MPANRSGRFVAVASSVIGLDEVLLAKRTWVGKKLFQLPEQIQFRLLVLNDRLDDEVAILG
jgi:hypothetical protein